MTSTSPSVPRRATGLAVFARAALIRLEAAGAAAAVGGSTGPILGRAPGGEPPLIPALGPGSERGTGQGLSSVVASDTHTEASTCRREALATTGSRRP